MKLYLGTFILIRAKDVIGTTWLVMRGTRHDKGELLASILMGFYRGKKKRAPSFI